MDKMININKSDDPFYRYTMPKIVIKYEGQKTILQNIKDISKSLNRPEEYIYKYIGYELGTNVILKDNIVKINGVFSNEKIQELIFNFINNYVLCTSCNNPETTIEKYSKQLKLLCKSCGHTSSTNSLSSLDHKLTNFIFQTLKKNT